MRKETAINISIGTLILLISSGGPTISLAAGGLAGYLESNNPRKGTRVGVIAGAVALVLVLILSLIRNYQEAVDHGISHYLWISSGYPAIQGIMPFLVLPMVGGAIGAYIRKETYSKSG